MKTTKLKSFCLCIWLLFLSACNQTNSQTNKSKSLSQTKKMTAANGMFTGTYEASYQNATISAELSDDKNVVKGFLYMDGVQNELIAISNKSTMSGKVKDKSKNVYYDFTAQLKDNILHFSITFPELENKIVELILTKKTSITHNANAKITTTESPSVSNTKPKDRRLIGTWRYTEVLSSGGYGSSYASMATDYFIQFKPNGQCLSWVGSTAGGSSDVSIENRGNSKVTTEGWYTQAKNVIFFNLTTNEEVSIPFLADENRFVLKGGSTKIYQRVN